MLQSIKANAQDFEVILQKALSYNSIAAKQLENAVHYSVLGGGKRFRPFLVRLVADLYNVNKELALNASVAIELIHCYSLVHDDLPAMDDDDLRRGQPTTHKKYDEATAILAGDILQTMAFSHLLRLNLSQQKIIALSQCLTIASQDMVSGQMLDMQAETKDANELTLKDIQQIQRLKTGAIIAASAKFGAILGNASNEEQKNIYQWGLELGEAFQISDDLLDMYGSEEKAGKRLQKDDDHGKVTFVTLLGAKGAKERVLQLQQSAAQRLAKYGNKADNLNGLWQWLIARDF
ncbi:MAG: polyprenyl synthetase family protein [Alphaproteobacteria bacterium]